MTSKFFATAGAPIKAWVEGVPIEDQALQQLKNLAELPFIHHHVAAMPDVHWGMGATIGSVIATKGAIIPAAVGVDIGCGMSAQRTTLTASDLPDNLGPLRSAIEAAIPHGRTNDGGPGDQGAHQDPPACVLDAVALLQPRLSDIVGKHAPIGKAANRAAIHAGTLGGGNHFVEVCLDEEQRVWVMLHSGSRGIGNRKRAAELLNITEPSDEPISYAHLLDVLGLEDALWCCQAEPDLAPVWRRYAVWCARQVQHLMTDQRSLDALDVAERHASGAATDEELAAVRGAAWTAAWTVEGEAQAAVRAAAWTAAWAVAWTAEGEAQAAVRAAAWTAAEEAQVAAFRRLVTTGAFD